MRMRGCDRGDLWWKSSVFYCVDVETFYDWERRWYRRHPRHGRAVEYLAALGVTCLWLMPYYPTPGRDDGYDITDIFGVDPRLGSPGDLVEFVRTAAIAASG